MEKAYIHIVKIKIKIENKGRRNSIYTGVQPELWNMGILNKICILEIKFRRMYGYGG